MLKYLILVTFTFSLPLFATESRLLELKDYMRSDFSPIYEEVLDENIDSASEVRLKIDRSCIKDGKLSLPNRFSLEKLKKQVEEIIYFHAEYLSDLRNNKSYAFNFKKIYVCSKRYNQGLKLAGEALHFNPQKLSLIHSSGGFFGTPKFEVLSSWSIRKLWDRADIFSDNNLKLKAAWFLLNPVGPVQVNLRQFVGHTIDKILEMRKGQLSNEQEQLLRNKFFFEEVVAGKVKSTIKDFGRLKKELKQIGLINVGNYHDIEVSSYINTDVDTFFESADVDEINVLQVGIVNVYTIDEVSVHLSVSEREILNISKYFLDKIKFIPLR